MAAVVREGVELRAADLATMPGHQRHLPHRLAHVGHRVEPAVRHAFDQVDHLVGCIIVVGLPDQPGAVGREGHPLQRGCHTGCGIGACRGRAAAPTALAAVALGLHGLGFARRRGEGPALERVVGPVCGIEAEGGERVRRAVRPDLERVCRFVGADQDELRVLVVQKPGVRDVDPAFVRELAREILRIVRPGVGKPRHLDRRVPDGDHVARLVADVQRRLRLARAIRGGKAIGKLRGVIARRDDVAARSDRDGLRRLSFPLCLRLIAHGGEAPCRSPRACRLRTAAASAVPTGGTHRGGSPASACGRR